MEPGHEDREYAVRGPQCRRMTRASMEPGHEDREYPRPQHRERPGQAASMEPGHEDREYAARLPDGYGHTLPQWSPVMKTGNTRSTRARTQMPSCLNGARS